MGKRYVITTVIEFVRETDVNEFTDSASAESAGYYYRDQDYSCVESVSVDEIDVCDECGRDLYDSCECDEDESEDN